MGGFGTRGCAASKRNDTKCSSAVSLMGNVGFESSALLTEGAGLEGAGPPAGGFVGSLPEFDWVSDMKSRKRRVVKRERREVYVESCFAPRLLEAHNLLKSVPDRR